MSQTARKFTHVSAADHLAAENDGSWRHEFVNGVVYGLTLSVSQLYRDIEFEDPTLSSTTERAPRVG